MDQSAVKVRDFNHHRQVLYKDVQILIQKNSVPRRIIFSKKNSSLKITYSQSKKIFEYKIDLPKASHIVIYKSSLKFNKIAYFAKNKQMYFNSQPLICNTYNYSLNSEMLKTLSNKISDFKISNLFDPQSCSKIAKSDLEIFEDQIKMEFDPTESSLVKCLSNNEDIQKTLNKNNQYASYAFETLSKYLSLTESIVANKNPIKIKCEMSGTNTKHAASIDESKTPMEMSFNLEKLKDSSSADFSQKMITDSFKVRDLKNHEELHRGNVSIPTIDAKYDDNENEKKVLYLSCLCSVNSQKKTETQSCDDYLVKSVDMNTTESGASIASQKNNDQELKRSLSEKIAQFNREEKTSIELAKNTKPLTITAAEETAIDQLAKTTFTTPSGTTVASNGESNTAILPPSISSGLESLYNSASEKMTNIQAALQASVKTAQASGSNSMAATASSSSRGIASISSSTTSKASSVTVLSREEIKTDQESANFENATDTGSKLSTIAAVSAFGGAAVAAKAATDSTGSKGVGAVTGTATKGVSGSSTTSSPLSVSTKRVAAETEDPNLATGAESDSETDNPAAAPNRNVASVSNITATPLDNRTIQTLSNFTEIAGTQYTSIQTNCAKDPNFSKMLATRGISIKQANGVCGAPQQSAKIKFIDTGKGLVKQDK